MLRYGRSKDEIGVVKKSGDSYQYEGDSYDGYCKIKITVNSKSAKVTTNQGCSGRDEYDGTYKYSGKTSASDSETIKSSSSY